MRRITFIPKPIRTAHHWEPGQKLTVIDTGDGILLKPAESFPETSLDQVAACLKDQGRSKTLAEMEEAIRKGADKVQGQEAVNTFGV